MQLHNITAQQAALELLRRRRARCSLVDYSQAITIPGAPVSEDPDEWLFKPVETKVAAHHLLTMQAIERCIRKPMGRLMVFEPPGSAKSTYTSVVAPTWAMGAFPGLRVLMTSYAGKAIIRHSKRARQIVGSKEYRAIWPDGSLDTRLPPPPPAALIDGSNASDEWELANGSGLFAAGLLGGITSTRSDLGIIDDPVAGRQEAQSPTVRKSTRAAYDDDFLTRLKPNASVILIQTRWDPQDLAGGILPEDWNGESGIFQCRDGMEWEVLCIPAKAERADDPLGRQVGEYLWPEWFPAAHWKQYENNPRTWASLYQQRPRPDEGNQFEADWFQWYDAEEVPKELVVYSAHDYAVTEESLENDPDYTEHGIFGVDDKGDIWILDWWFGREETDMTIAAELRLQRKWKPRKAFGESGVIEKAIAPLIRRLSRESETYTVREWLPSLTDKVSRVAGFRGRAHAGTVHVPKGKPWAVRLVDQLVDFPAGRYKDGVDVCGLIGRALDQMRDAKKPSVSVRKTIKPFSVEHLEYSERQGQADSFEQQRSLR